MSHIFISYSRQDQAYVTLLAQALESHRLPLWLDDRITYGSEWPREIQKHLDDCLAFVLVMSPRSRESRWVSNELTRAIRLRKPIFPLWLEGDIWFEVESYQAFDVRRKNVPPVRFFNDLRPYFPAPASTADSITLQDVVAETQPSRLKPPAPKSKATQTQPQAEDPSSEKGIDYTRLRDLLAAQDWKAADQETADRMCEVMGRQEEGWLRVEDIEKFPCLDLRTIDRLWVKYSNGKFGFSVQKEIWQSCGSPTSYNREWEKFGDTVGWKDPKGWPGWNAWYMYTNYTFEYKNARNGHLPSLLVLWVMLVHNVAQFRLRGWELEVGYLFSRVKTCKL